jgi:AcrR family transcriptional regulator
MEAAGEVFAQRGYKAATIQEISQRANVNIASVNYHFRDKEGLYREVFRYAIEQSRERYLACPVDASEGRPAQRLKLELRRHLQVMFSADRAPWQAMMFFREMLEPTEVFDSLVEAQMRPYQQLIEALVREVLGSQSEERVVRFSAFAALSLCGSFHTSQKYIEKLYPGEGFDGENSDELAELITTFVIGGLRALKSSGR